MQSEKETSLEHPTKQELQLALLRASLILKITSLTVQLVSLDLSQNEMPMVLEHIQEPLDGIMQSFFEKVIGLGNESTDTCRPASA